MFRSIFSSFFNRKYLKNNEFYDATRYVPINDGDITPINHLLPSIYGFRVVEKHALNTPDPRPSFAILENDQEIADWMDIYNGPAERETDSTALHGLKSYIKMINFHSPVSDLPNSVVSDKPLLVFNHKPSTRPDSGIYITINYVPEIYVGRRAVGPNPWPPLVLTMCSETGEGPPEGRLRYGFEQIDPDSFHR